MCLYLHLARARANRKYDVGADGTGNSPFLLLHEKNVEQQISLIFLLDDYTTPLDLMATKLVKLGGTKFTDP